MVDPTNLDLEVGHQDVDQAVDLEPELDFLGDPIVRPREQKMVEIVEDAKEEIPDGNDNRPIVYTSANTIGFINQQMANNF